MGKTAAAKVKQDKGFSLPSGVVADFSCFDWGDEKITDKQKLFVYWFSMPLQEAFHCGLKAARKAGYTDKSALVNAYKMRRDPKIDRLIKRFEETVGKVDVMDTAQRWLQEKTIRGDYDVNDFYETVEYTDIKGVPHKKLVLRPLDKLTPEQRLCVDGVDVKGMSGTMVYSLPDREKVRDSLIEFMRKQGMENNDNDEETMEIITERLTVKKTIRKEKDEVSRIAGLVRLPKGEAITEL